MHIKSLVFQTSHTFWQPSDKMKILSIGSKTLVKSLTLQTVVIRYYYGLLILTLTPNIIKFITMTIYIYSRSKTMARVSVPFTEGHYCGRGERPNTEPADNSLSACF